MPPEIVFLMLFAALAGTVQGTVGFGFGLVAMGTLPLWIGPKEAVPIVALLCLVVNATLTWRLRNYLTWSRLGPLIIGSLVGVPVGVTLFVTLNPDWLTGGLGLALIVVCIQQVLSDPKPMDSGRTSPFWGGLAGLGSGILGGAFNTGGPPALMYVGVQTWSKEHTMATLQGFFLSTCVLQITLFTIQGTVGLTQVKDAAILLIPALVGVGVGQLLFHRINQQKFRSLLTAGIGLLGCILTYKSASALLG